MQSEFSTDYELVFDNANNQNAYADNDNKVIHLNENLASNYAPILVHEYLGHVVGDFIPNSDVNNIFNSIKDTSWYNEHYNELYNSYLNDENARNFTNEQDREAYYRKEVVNKYVEQAFSSNTNTSIRTIKELLNRENKLQRFLNRLLNRSYATMLENDNIIKEFARQIDRVLSVINGSNTNVIAKFIANETLTQKEQNFVNKYKSFFDGLNRAITSVEYSRKRSNLDEAHKRKLNEISKVKYFENIKNSVMLPYLTNKDVDYLEIMTKRNLTSEEIADMPIYQYAKNYIDSHPKLLAEENEPLIKKVLDEFRNEIIKEANDRINGKNINNKQRKVLFVIGLPGAGKSSGFVSEFLNEYGAIEFDNDIAKTVDSLKEYYNNGLGASVVQDIVSEAQKRLLPELIKEGYNIVYPAIGKRIDKITSELNTYKNAGYELSLIEVSVSNETSQNRALKRFIETGRFVDPIGYIKGIQNKPDLVYNYLEERNNNESKDFNFTRN